MRFQKLAREPWFYGLLALIALAGAFGFGGGPGAAGMAVGLVSALFGVTVLWQLISILGGASSRGGSPGRATVLVVLGAFMKIPVYWAAWELSKRLGHAGPTCFLAGVVLVYFGLVAWASARD